MSNLAKTDRLRDRGFIDQWGFVFFAFVGFAAIVSAKALGADTVWIAVGAIASMLTYAVIIGWAGTGRVRADQAGDNCYYLGLIYTLASLSYAIWTFDPAGTATTIVQGFGIALATTIVGLILRVFFNQGRPDLENVEEQTRLEMTDAVIRLKAELGDVVRQLNDFTRMVQQSMLELQQSTTKSIQTLTNDTVQGLGTVVEVAASTIREEANDFAARSKRYSTTFDKLLVKLDQHADGIDLMKEAQESVQSTARAAESAASSAVAAVDALREGAEQARVSAVSTQETVASVRDLVGGFSVSVEKMQGSLREIQEESERRLEALRAAPTQGVSEVMSALSQASEALKLQASETAQLHATVHAGITARSEEALKASRTLNAQLEQELQRSRELVEKVHKSLADMTSKLVVAVEHAT
jgi:cytochrome c556